ncbi:MAG: InlB B-repeat-containing protein, partial [Treponema sp.]|nr:InlB B-repeat-containing protein [Treponema sp.]
MVWIIFTFLEVFYENQEMVSIFFDSIDRVCLAFYCLRRGGGAKTFTVIFETDGGSAVSSQTVAENAAVPEPEDPTKEGFIFSGWYSNPALTEVWGFDTPVTGNMTLYAKWVSNTTKYTVTFNSNGGSVVAQIPNVTPNSLITAPAAPTKDSFDFGGWYKDEELEHEWIFASSRVT